MPLSRSQAPSAVRRLALVCALVSTGAQAVVLSRAAPLDSAEHPAVARIDTAEGCGTGFLVRSDGLLITAYHVIYGAQEAWAHFPGGTACRVEGFVAVYPERDLALVKLDPAGLPEELKPIVLADASQVSPGAPVTAAGYPEGGRQRTSSGVVYVPAGSEPSSRDLQISAHGSHGCSGGPVLDSDGRAIGVVVAGSGRLEHLTGAAGLEGPALLPGANAPVRPLADIVRQAEGGPADLYARAIHVLEFWRGREGKEPADRTAAAFALRQLRRVAALWPRSATVRMTAGICSSRLGKKAEALRFLQEAVRLDPRSLPARYALTCLYGQAHRPAAAEVHAREMVHLAPGFAAGRVLLSMCLLDGKAYASAVAQLREAVRLDPDGLEAYLCLGGAYAAMRHHADAIGQYRKALEIKGGCVRAHYGLALAYRATGQRTRARSELDEVRRLDRPLAAKLRRKLRLH